MMDRISKDLAMAQLQHLNASVDQHQSSIKIDLDNSELWRKFHEHTTEMIVTKSGRRMFPTLRFNLSGLEPSATYAIFLELSQADDCRYKFQNGRWIVAGRAEPCLSAQSQRSRMYAHPDSPAPGRLWMRQPLAFHRIKLTNNVQDPQGNVLLNSMHKYQPRVFVMRLHDYFPSVPQLVASATFVETQFTAVTAYQNEKVIQLKIDHNPFAKGFRDNAINNDRKRSASSQDLGVRLPDNNQEFFMKRARFGDCGEEMKNPATGTEQHSPEQAPKQTPESLTQTCTPQTQPVAPVSAFTSALLLASPCSSTSGRSTSSISNSSPPPIDNENNNNNNQQSINKSIWNPLIGVKQPRLNDIGMGWAPPNGLVSQTPTPLMMGQPLLPAAYYALYWQQLMHNTHMPC